MAALNVVLFFPGGFTWARITIEAKTSVSTSTQCDLLIVGLKKKSTFRASLSFNVSGSYSSPFSCEHLKESGLTVSFTVFAQQ